jgi:uncharacterized membrane protein YfcA
MNQYLLDVSILALASFLAGAQNSLAGGGTLYTFPTLLTVLGDAVAANGTSTAALLPGSMAGAWGFRDEVRHTPKRTLLILAVPSLLGGIIGTLLVVKFPEKVFRSVVPWLIFTAALLFLLQPRISRLVGAKELSHRPSPLVAAGVVLFQLIVAIYGGYFGAGIGILMLSSLSLMGLGNIHRVNALKTLLAACINVMSVVIFAVEGATRERPIIAWRYAIPMALAAIAGGYIGARFSLRINRTILRWIIIVIGFALAAYYLIV